MNCSPPGSSVHGILQARILEWVAIPFSKGSSQSGFPALQADSLRSESLGKPSVSLDKYREVLKQEKSVAGLPVDASQGT